MRRFERLTRSLLLTVLTVCGLPTALFAQSPSGPITDDGSVIDVMVLYTPAAETAAGGAGPIAALVNDSVTLTNTAFANSDIVPRIRLVYSGRVAYTEWTPGDVYNDYSRLRLGLGSLSGVAELRNTYRADLVVLLTDRPTPARCDAGGVYLGQGSEEQAAFSAVEQSCAVANLSFPHAIGRSMGASDEWYYDDTTLPYTYSHGSVNTTTAVRTLDTSDSGLCLALGIICTKIPYFSNPGVTYNGAPIGVAAGTKSGYYWCYHDLTNPACDADNHLALNNNAFAVANFRPPTLTVRTFAARQPLPAAPGTTITWDAFAVSGAGPVTYKFWVYNGTSWSVGQDWGTSSIFNWMPPAVGSYTLQVWARNAGSASTYDAWLGATASVRLPSPPVVTALPLGGGPYYAGTSYSLSASAYSGLGPYSYKFWMNDGSGWGPIQDWSASPTAQWWPTHPGSYSMQVWVRSAGSSAPYDSWAAWGPITVVEPPPPVIDSIVADPGNYYPGSLIRVRATVHGAAAPYNYTFWVVNSSGVATLASSWSDPNGQPPSTLTWLASASGTYTFLVRVGSAGSSTAVAWAQSPPVTVQTLPAWQVTSLLTERTFPSTQGVPIRFTAFAPDGGAPNSYKFFVFDGTSWSVAQDWSWTSTLTWTPATPGTYSVQVWMKGNGSAAPYDGWASVGPFQVQAIPPLRATDLTADHTLPSLTGVPVSFHATASAGAGPYSYKFWVFNGTSWAVIRDWSSFDHVQWTPDTSGTYTVQAWVRNAGSTATYDAWTSFGPFQIVAAPPPAVTLTADHTGAFPVGTLTTVTAVATGGNNDFTYKFYLYDGTAWVVARDWSSYESFQWFPKTPGTYRFQVWVRNAGSTAVYDAWAGLGPLTITP